ncbi:hypothetical protein L1987_00645 [Smallanthus sonchifolius]|uniref:Uncharacterized protein n=1 Tax=Smallanthus sonchifolius TaxID=185202 RepID=A0ACB9K2X4_9ASTR|nr:hypothetical protein L1987_00645 [Smallanthus sonchifolius]
MYILIGDSSDSCKTVVMMVLTRTRSDEDSRVPTTESVAEGNVSATTTRTTCRRKRGSDDTRSAEQSAATEQLGTEQPAIEPPATEQLVDPPKRRGRSLNRKVNKTLENLGVGSKIPLTMDTNITTFIGESATAFATDFATEIGIVIRNDCPMNFHKWDLIPEAMKTILYEKLEGKFQLLRTNKAFMKYVDGRLHAQCVRTRDDWNHLCDYWELEKTRKYSDNMEANRAKQVMISRGGSRSIANHAYKMTNLETQMPPSPLELWYNMHFRAEKDGWLNDHSRIQYENILQHKKAAMDESNSEGTTIDTAMEHKFEKAAIKSVCGRQKSIQSGWEIGVGPVLKKKDNWMKPVAESSQRDSIETNEDLRNQVTAFKEKLKQNEEKMERMSQFINTKFPEFKSTTSNTPPRDVSDDAFSDNDS